MIFRIYNSWLVPRFLICFGGPNPVSLIFQLKTAHLHSNNIHQAEYDFPVLIEEHPELEKFVYLNQYGRNTIDFAIPEAVLHLNKALLKNDYDIQYWEIPENNLCPPIPGRADYILHLADLLQDHKVDKKQVKGLDIGVGANCIYPLLGARIFQWKMTGADINPNSIKAAEEIVTLNQGLKELIRIKKQPDNAHIFKNIIEERDFFDFSMCNPPFYLSEEEAVKSNFKKIKGLGISKKPMLNFGGKANELWCNGGESLFIKRMIKESVVFRKQVQWFTSLVSKKENLSKIYKQLDKLGATYKTVEMEQGNKKSRFVAWSFSA